MGRHLPSLSALRAFEATARHLSFTRAAVELNLTQTAISHRIKELEGLLMVKLFARKQSAISLTEEGRAYLDSIRPALAQIASATDGISSVRENRLNITCLSAFAFTCLIPALPNFQNRHPGIALRLMPSAATGRPDMRDFDVAVWHGPNDWPGFESARISKEEIFPVCSPQLLANRPQLETPADLRHYSVVRTVSPIITDEWPAWLQHTGHESTEFGGEIYCEGLFFSMASTRAGLGVGLGRSSLVKDDLANGRLVEPFGVRLPSDSAYYAVSRPDKSALPRVKVFTEWLLEYFG
ncbi:LysR substrate-binding domain-containing protein [Bordetella sp. BOR01]|uniref:LysR substrate-binding domain-containing protein n=1 Tax=Bordetella sp. BOR01 TaxID=2854779 RepID=UPI001C4525AA|nr:LysR substrate-binding domain-containing protein [Bordetella sp. BOR01]MBV7484900.1 LysR family transcriptional regulator [Bordetella sp. BOR01]